MPLPKSKLDLVAARPLPAKFYRQEALSIAPQLLGKVLVVEKNVSLAAGIIVETEAYQGTSDPASHAFRGKTRRNQSMFEAGGICYVYLTYGMHFCLNVVTGGAGAGEAVLIRALEPLAGVTDMARRRGLDLTEDLSADFADHLPAQAIRKRRLLTNGPAKLAAALGVTLLDDGHPLNTPEFKIVDLRLPLPGKVRTSPRIGISKAVDLPWRFYVENSPYLSR